MPERATVFEVTQIGPEVVPGTAVNATKKLLATSIEPSIKSEVNTYIPKGSRFTTVAVQNREWTEAKITQDVAVYTDTSYMLAGLLGPPSISTVDTGVYLHEWDPLTFTGLTPKTFTVENGSYVRAMEFAYGVVKTYGMDFTRKGVKASGDMFGQKTTDGTTLTAGTAEVQTMSKTSTVSGGTFTVSFMGETTSALAYNVSNADMLTALLALPNLATGDVTLGGGPISSSSVTITFGGQYASADVPLMVVNSASLTGGGSYNIAQTTAGVALSEVGLQPISGDEWSLAIATTAAGIGAASALDRAFAASWKISDMYGPVWPAKGSSYASFAAHVDLVPKTEFKFKVAADATGMGYLAQLQAGDSRFARINCTGPTLGSSTYLANFDFALKLTDISDFSDEDGVYAVEYTAEIAHDTTWGKALSFDVRNNIASIA